VQQMFSDLNRFVQKTSKSLDILYDKRDKISASTLASIEQVPVFQALTAKDNVSLKAKSTKLFTLAALYDANRELLKGREDSDIMGNATLLTTYWKAVAENMVDWDMVLHAIRRLASCARRNFPHTRRYSVPLADLAKN
jgi:DNA sulfur modification protein DndB